MSVTKDAISSILGVAAVPVKTLPPANISYSFIGRPQQNDPEVFVGDTIISHWGIMRSIQIGVYRNEQPAFDIAHYDMGVKLREGKIWLQMQFRDAGRDVSKHVYRVEGNIQFLGMAIGLDIDWFPIGVSEQGSVG